MSRPLPKPRPFPAPRRQVEEVSAGGIVVDFTSRTLSVAVIARINRASRLEWCLPKGHLEHDETAAQAARREISEETGIEGAVITALGSVDYWFSAGGMRIHKVVHHFLLRATGGTLTVEGDPDHEAIDAMWVPFNELQARLSFANERRIALAAAYVLPRYIT